MLSDYAEPCLQRRTGASPADPRRRRQNSKWHHSKKTSHIATLPAKTINAPVLESDKDEDLLGAGMKELVTTIQARNRPITSLMMASNLFDPTLKVSHRRYLARAVPRGPPQVPLWSTRTALSGPDHNRQMSTMKIVKSEISSRIVKITMYGKTQIFILTSKCLTL